MIPEAEPVSLLISSDFFPKIGGAHHWMYEVYRRWPQPVTGFVGDYSALPEMKRYQEEFDRQLHGSLELRRMNLQLGEINLTSLAFWRNLIKTARYPNYVSAGKSVTLHCLRAFPDGLTGLIFKCAKRKQRRLVTYAHGEEILIAGTSRQINWIARRVYKGSDLIIANSRFTEGVLRRLCPNARVAVIYPGVDSKVFEVSEARRHAQRTAWGLPDGAIVLTTVARMEPRKNHAAVLRAMSALRSKGHPLVYVIGSTGEEQLRLREMAQDLGLSRWVRFTGRLSDEERILTFASADIHVMPSIQIGPMIEGFGIVFLEAAAAGTPSIGGKVGGQPEAVINDLTGYVIDGEDPEDLEKAMMRLSADAGLRHRMGAEGRRWAMMNDWGEVTRKTYEAVRQASAS